MVIYGLSFSVPGVHSLLLTGQVNASLADPLDEAIYGSFFSSAPQRIPIAAIPSQNPMECCCLSKAYDVLKIFVLSDESCTVLWQALKIANVGWFSSGILAGRKKSSSPSTAHFTPHRK